MKKDIIAIGLYTVLMDQYLKARETERVLCEHLSANYEFTGDFKKYGWEASDVLAEVIYDDELNVEKFLKEISKRMVKK